MTKNIMDEKLMCDIVYDRLLSNLCCKWYDLHIKPDLVIEEQIEKERIHQEIIQFHKDHYENTDYEDS
jgi:hypothetical protein